MKKFIAVLISSFAISGCASIQPARMVQPAGFDALDSMTVSGIGGGRRGVYAAGPYRGSFSRNDDRLGFFDDLIEERRGQVEFTLAGPNIEGTLDISCRMRERAINISVLSFKPQRMAYRCDFEHNGLPIAARFEIQEIRRGLAGALNRQERRGEIALDRVILQIESVHDLQATPIQMATPIGYRFEANGLAVGTVEINGKPVIRVAPGTDEATRRAITAASIALGIFWDPANSAL